jgi:hypothetical protein
VPGSADTQPNGRGTACESTLEDHPAVAALTTAAILQPRLDAAPAPNSCKATAEPNLE